jgi:hypothetical protein
MSTLRGGTNAIAINGSGGAYTSIKAKQTTSTVTIQEDPSNNPLQGFVFQLAKDNYAYTYTIPSGGSFMIQESRAIDGSGQACWVGVPEQNLANGVGAFNYAAPTEYMKAKSLTAIATSLQVLEED